MKDIRNLETSVLIDMLAEYTEEYTRMLSNNERSGAFDDCEWAIYLLQGEINSRIGNSDNISTPKITIDKGYRTAI